MLIGKEVGVEHLYLMRSNQKNANTYNAVKLVKICFPVDQDAKLMR